MTLGQVGMSASMCEKLRMMCKRMQGVLTSLIMLTLRNVTTPPPPRNGYAYRYAKVCFPFSISGITLIGTQRLCVSFYFFL